MAAVNDLAIKVLRRECFVTIGATASFGDLIVACLSEDFLSTLKSLKYTTLTVQYGPDVELFRFHLDEARRLGWADGLTISGFSYNKEGLGAEMRACKRLAGTSMEGVVICHAGAGSILDAMRISVPTIVVPNPSLLDNHQIELAEELEEQGYVIHGKLDNLPGALKAVAEQVKNRAYWSPGTAIANGQPASANLCDIMDEELGNRLTRMGIEFDNPWDYVPPRRRSIHTLGEKMGIMCIYITVRQIILAHEEHAEFRARVVAANTKKQARFEKLLAFNKIYDHAEGYWLNPYPDSGAETAQEEMKVPPGQDLKDTEWMDRQKEVNERDRGRRGLRLDPMENEMHQNDVKNEEGQATIELAERKKQAGETVQTEKRKRTRRIRSVEHDWVARHQEVQERQYEKKMALAEKRRVYDEDAAWERKEKRTQKEKEREAWWTLENFSY